MEAIFERLMTQEGLEQLFREVEQLGLIVGFLLVFMESFLPFLPLFIIVVVNINSYGFILGSLSSYSGTVLGSYLVFLLIRYFFRRSAQKYIRKHKRLGQMLSFIDRRGFVFLFVLLSLPFTPTSVINVIAALSNLKKVVYLYILLAAKAIMILTMSLVGYDVTSFFTSPLRLTLSIAGLVLIYFFSKGYQKYINRKMDK
ncbi:TVP38/TMEM64 family protein [Salinicoccus carnicancri]|uniref:TVP38/TMEM64 family protein n=1 Tax=Salinicoccus carnicancri TaxID=558170 RepID=UPI0002E523B3|nr:VTT domain-containing protein [Salinicoccus carnicancri]